MKVNFKDIPLLEAVIIDEEDGTNAVSFVDRPAIKANYIALAEETEAFEVKMETVDEEKQIVMGPILIPNLPIYRKYGETEFNMFFSEETIRLSSELFLKNSNQDKVTAMHEKLITGIYMVESWIVEDPEKDKSAIYNFDVPTGTWMASFKVDNEVIWEDFIKTGELQGFSIEGVYNFIESDADISDEEVVAQLRELLGVK